MRYLIRSLVIAYLTMLESSLCQAQPIDAPPKRTETTTKKESVNVEKKATARELKELERVEHQLRSEVRNLSLDNLLAQALKDNPDIRVAEAKMREAEAELNRVKLQVTQKVVTQQRELVMYQSALKQAQANFDRIQALHRQGATSTESIGAAEASLQKAKAELARIEAELPYILGSTRPALQIGQIGPIGGQGGQPGRSGGQIGQIGGQIGQIGQIGGQIGQGRSGGQIGQLGGQIGQIGTFGGGFGVAGSGFGVAGGALGGPGGALGGQFGMSDGLRAKGQLRADTSRLPESMATKIRTALDTPVQVNFNEVSPKDILAFLQQHAKGCNLVDQAHFDKNVLVSLRLTEPVPLGAIFQFLEDKCGVNFVIREYGIVMAHRGTMPPGAISLQAFWKDRTPTAVTSPSAGQKK